MASEADHIQLANRNHGALLHLLSDVARYPEWFATIAFYKAVHVVEAAFAHHSKIHSTTHNDRERTLKTATYRALFMDYITLSNASRIARYLADSSGSYTCFSDFLDEEGVKNLVRKRLYRVEQNAMRFLSAKGRGALLKVEPATIK